MAPSTTLLPLVLVTPVLPTGTNVLSIDASVLPFVINADTNTTRIEVGIYNTTYAITSSSLVGQSAAAPLWNMNITYTVGQVVSYLSTNYIALTNTNPNVGQYPSTSPLFWATYIAANQFTQSVSLMPSVL